MEKLKIGKENNTNAQTDFKQFGSFVEKFVLNEELDNIYSQKMFQKMLYQLGKFKSLFQPLPSWSIHFSVATNGRTVFYLYLY